MGALGSTAEAAAALRADEPRVQRPGACGPCPGRSRRWTASPSWPPACWAPPPRRSTCSATSRRRRRGRRGRRHRRHRDAAGRIALHGHRVDRGAPLVVADAAADERVAHLPPVGSGEVGAYLGVPLAGRTAAPRRRPVRVRPGPADLADGDVALLRQLAASAVAELELSALVGEYEASRLRWGLAIDAAGIGTFDWDLAPAS